MHRLIRAPITITMGILLVISWILIWWVQVLFIAFTKPLGTTREWRSDICSHIQRKISYVFTVLLNPLWWSKEVGKPFDHTSFAHKKKVLIMANHMSNADGYLMVRPMGFSFVCSYVVKASLLYVPFGGWSLKNCDELVVKFTSAKNGWGTEKGSVSAMMEDAKSKLRRGKRIGVFPEGARNPNPSGPVGEFKLGFFNLAFEEQATIVPMAITGSENAWPLHDWMFDFAISYTSVGDPIDAADFSSPEELRDHVYRVISNLRDQHPDRKAQLLKQQ